MVNFRVIFILELILEIENFRLFKAIGTFEIFEKMKKIEGIKIYKISKEP